MLRGLPSMSKKHSAHYVYFLLCLVLWIYLALRAYHVPLAHDEISTFHRYVHTGRFMPPGAHPDANNHILNSALSWAFYSLFGSSAFVLRLGNLLCAPLFFYFWFRIASQLKHLAIRWIFLLSFVGSTYFLEFFALSRGYGMSMAFLAGGLWHLIRLLKDNRQKDRALTLLWLLLAVCANLTLINTLLLVSAGMAVHLFSRQGSKWLSATIILVMGFLPAAVFTVLLLHMKKLGLLYYGNTSGFYQLTIKSLAAVITESDSLLYPLFALLLFGLSTVLVFLKIKKDKMHWSSLFQESYLFYLLLLGNLVAVILSAKLFNANYPEDRTGLYFFPLLIGASCFLASDHLQNTRGQDVLLFLVPLLLLPTHLIKKLNLDHSSYYHEDTIPARFYKTVHAFQKEGDYPPSIGGYRQRQLCWYYLNYRNGGTGSAIHYSNYPDTTDEYQITRGSLFPNWQLCYDSLDYEPASDFLLLKRKKPLLISTLATSINIATKGVCKSEYTTLMEGALDSTCGRNMEWRFDLTVESASAPFEAWVVLSLFDADGKDAGYEYIALDWLKTQWKKGDGHLLNSLRATQIDPRAVRYVLYLWNQRQVPYELRQGKVEACRLY